MTRFIAVCVTAVVLGLGGPVRAAEDKDVSAILDKAIKALGGEEKLTKLTRATWKSKGTISLMGADNEVATVTTVDGLDKYRQEFEGEFGVNKVTGLTILAGDKGWRKLNTSMMPLDEGALANQKRSVYLAIVPISVLPLKGKGFKVEKGAEEKVGGKAAVGLKCAGPDGKDFQIYFDKESGLPVKLVATVAGFMGEDFKLETTFGDYKDMGGIKKATKLDSTRDGEKFQNLTVVEFKPLDKVDAKTFAEPAE